VKLALSEFILQQGSPEPFGYAQESRAEGLRMNEIGVSIAY
jgi:hypothetical protein